MSAWHLTVHVGDCGEDMICRIISQGLTACRGCYPHIHLKDIETVENDLTRLTRWVTLTRKVADDVWT